MNFGSALTLGGMGIVGARDAQTAAQQQELRNLTLEEAKRKAQLEQAALPFQIQNLYQNQADQAQTGKMEGAYGASMFGNPTSNAPAPGQPSVPMTQGLPAPSNAPNPNDPSWHRGDGSMKGTGFMGVLPGPQGKVMSEVTIGVPINGQEMNIPTIVPGMSQEQIQFLQNGGDPRSRPDIVTAAVQHAKQRLAEGKSVFAGPQDQAGAPPMQPGAAGAAQPPQQGSGPTTEHHSFLANMPPEAQAAFQSTAQNQQAFSQLDGLYDFMRGWYKQNPDATDAQKAAAYRFFQTTASPLVQAQSKERDALLKYMLETMKIGRTEAHYATEETHWRRMENKAVGGAPVSEGDLDKTAKDIAEYRLPPPSAYSMRSPQGLRLMARVAEMNPQYDVTQYQQRSQAVKAFATGKEGQAMRSMNVAIDHLDTMKGLVDALGNGDIKLANKLAQGYAAQTGGTAPTNFDAAKSVVAKEVVKAIVAGGGGVKEREDAEQLLSRANSPQALMGAIDTLQKLMGGQLRGLQRQYEDLTGNKDFSKRLSPQARQALGETSSAGSTPDDIQSLLDKYSK